MILSLVMCRQVGAIIEKKLIGYIGACWHIREMGREKDVSWRYIKKSLRTFLNEVVKNREEHDIENQINDTIDAGEDEKEVVVNDCTVSADGGGEKAVVVIEDTHTHLVEESLNEGCEVENYEIATDECGDDIEEVIGAECMNKVNDAADTVDSTVELQGLNVHH